MKAKRVTEFTADPAVLILFREAKRKHISHDLLATLSGQDKYKILQWRYRSQPTTNSLRACLRAVGLDLVVVRPKVKK